MTTRIDCSIIDKSNDERRAALDEDYRSTT